jgi:SpoU rRNA methylase family enzyme
MLRFIYGLISGILICVISYAITHSHIDESDSRSYEAKFGISSINKAIEMYYKEVGKLPDNEEGIEKLSPKYVEVIQHDPWGNEYLYATFKIKGKSCFVVWSYGSDLKPGGIDHAEDVFVFGKNGNCF